MKVERVEQIINITNDAVQKISLPYNLPLTNKISATVLLNNNKDTIINTHYGLIKLPLIENLAMNQNISVGLYDIPDRTNMVKLQITIPKINSLDDRIYHFILQKDSINHQLRQREDIVEITGKKIEQTIYQVLIADNSDHRAICNLELNNVGQGKVFLNDNNIYININDRLYRIIEEVPTLKSILSIGPQSIYCTMNHNFNLNEDFIHLLKILPKTLPIQSLVEIISVLSQTTQLTIPIGNNYLEVYKTVFLPIFSHFRKANLQLRESYRDCATLRFIFELELEDGSLNIIDCLYMSSSHSLTIVVRSDYRLNDDLQGRLTESFNCIISQLQLYGSISFVVQSTAMLRQISTYTSDENYTYNI